MLEVWTEDLLIIRTRDLAKYDDKLLGPFAKSHKDASFGSSPSSLVLSLALISRSPFPFGFLLAPCSTAELRLEPFV